MIRGVDEKRICEHGMFIETQLSPSLEVVTLPVAFAAFRAQLVHHRLEFSPRTVETVVIDLLQPGSNHRRRDKGVKHLRPPWRTMGPLGAARIYDGDVIDILIMIVVISNVETGGAFG